MLDVPESRIGVRESQEILGGFNVTSSDVIDICPYLIVFRTFYDMKKGMRGFNSSIPNFVRLNLIALFLGSSFCKLTNTTCSLHGFCLM